MNNRERQRTWRGLHVASATRGILWVLTVSSGLGVVVTGDGSQRDASIHPAMCRGSAFLASVRPKSIRLKTTR